MVCVGCQQRREAIARLAQQVGTVVFGGRKRRLAGSFAAEDKTKNRPEDDAVDSPEQNNPMANPELEIQGAIVQRLKADSTLTTLVAGRVYDQPPSNPVFPYVTIGPSDANDDDAECITGFLISQQIDGWSRAVGFPEVKKIADAVRLALHDVDLALTDNALVFFQHRQTRTIRDPDGLSSHSVLTFEATIEQP